MIGINLEKLEQLIKTNSYLLESSKNNSKLLTTSLEKTIDCYDGSSLKFLSFELNKQKEILKDIDATFNSYLVLLQSVKKSYVMQESVFAQQIKNIN